jgi:hypothetical protein
VLAYLLLRHEQDPLQDLSRPGPDEAGHHDQAESLPAHYVAHRAGPEPGVCICWLSCSGIWAMRTVCGPGPTPSLFYRVASCTRRTIVPGRSECGA